MLASGEREIEDEMHALHLMVLVVGVLLDELAANLLCSGEHRAVKLRRVAFRPVAIGASPPYSGALDCRRGFNRARKRGRDCLSSESGELGRRLLGDLPQLNRLGSSSDMLQPDRLFTVGRTRGGRE